ncbi:MAG: hypothetical protein DMG77_15445 [Acidobacteria bacterium]|nr:MAG: hypothetical protein DMG77_15445 [Acidobacteriota bacterium]
MPREKCTQWILTILPASIIVGETAEVRLTGEPDRCFDPKSYSWTGYEIENREIASGGGDSDKITGVAKITGRAEGTTKIYSKPFPAVTILTVRPQPICEKLEVHYSGSVEVGGVSLEPVVTYSPEHCKAPDPERVKKWFSGSPDEHAQVNFLTGAVTGIAPGKFEVIVNQEGVKQPGTTTLQVTPPWCTNLQVVYSPKSIHLPSEAASPTRHYSPYGCAPPSAVIEYALDPKDRDDDIATIVPATGVLKGKKARTAHVTVSQGQLSTSTSVEILPPH